ncbi:MAG: hypothetical protein ACJAZS_000065 [Alteromonas naphthalenivorans]|jgi:hypothetical protein
MKYLIVLLLTPFLLHTAQPKKHATSSLRGYSWRLDLSVYTPDITVWKLNYKILEQKLTVTRGDKTKSNDDLTFLNYCTKKSDAKPEAIFALHAANTIREHKSHDREIQHFLYHLDTFVSLHPDTRDDWKKLSTENKEQQDPNQKQTLSTPLMSKLSKIVLS